MEAHTKKSLSHEQIAAKAYQIWEGSGRPVGCDLKNWLQAEEELSNGASGKTSQSQAKFTQKQSVQAAEHTPQQAIKPQPPRLGAPIREASQGTRRSATPA